MRTIFTTYMQGKQLYHGDSLANAARVWDAATYNLGKSVAGGISVQVFNDDVMVRDGWIMHIHEDGTVYLSPHLATT